MSDVRLKQTVSELIRKSEYIVKKLNQNTNLIKGKIDTAAATAKLGEYQGPLADSQKVILESDAIPFTQQLKTILNNNARYRTYLGEIVVPSTNTDDQIIQAIQNFTSGLNPLNGDYVEVIKTDGDGDTTPNSIGYTTYTLVDSAWKKGAEKSYHVHEAIVDAFLKSEADAIFAKIYEDIFIPDSTQDNIFDLLEIEQFYTINEMLYGGVGMSQKVNSEIQMKGFGHYLVSKHGTTNFINNLSSEKYRVAVPIGNELFSEGGVHVKKLSNDGSGNYSWTDTTSLIRYRNGFLEGSPGQQVPNLPIQWTRTAPDYENENSLGSVLSLPIWVDRLFDYLPNI